VLRVLKGEDLDSLSRELGVSASRLAQWRDQALLGAQGSLKAQPRDAAQEELGRLRHKVGELTMDKELLEERLRRLGDPPGPRSRRSGR
jgi:transposase-like protein